MATLTRGITFGASETVTNTKLANLVDLGACSNILDADCSPSMNLSDTKLADITTGNKVRGSALGNLASIPDSAGLIPFANIGNIGISLASIPNSSILPLTLASWVDGSAMRNIQSMPSLAGQLAWYSVVASLASGAGIIFNGTSKFVGSPGLNTLTTGTFLEGSIATTEQSNAATTYTKLKELSPILRPGQVTVSWEGKVSVIAGTQGQKVYVNGSAVGVEKTTMITTYAVFTDTINVSTGDVIQIYGFNSDSRTNFAKNLKVLVANPTTVTESV